jgi:hypothetical protein
MGDLVELVNARLVILHTQVEELEKDPNLNRAEFSDQLLLEVSEILADLDDKRAESIIAEAKRLGGDLI